VVIITGTNETCLHPVPPVADSAPAWNIYRLAEAAGDLDLQVSRHGLSGGSLKP
jgi:hypothetical protein